MGHVSQFDLTVFPAEQVAEESWTRAPRLRGNYRIWSTHSRTKWGEVGDGILAFASCDVDNSLKALLGHIRHIFLTMLNMIDTTNEKISLSTEFWKSLALGIFKKVELES